MRKSLIFWEIPTKKVPTSLWKKARTEAQPSQGWGEEIPCVRLSVRKGGTV